MKYVFGIKLKSQPKNLCHGFKWPIFTQALCSTLSEDHIKIITNKEEIINWCNDTYGQPTYNMNVYYHWKFIYGSVNNYIFFESKDDATKFKLVWG